MQLVFPFAVSFVEKGFDGWQWMVFERVCQRLSDGGGEVFG